MRPYVLLVLAVIGLSGCHSRKPKVVDCPSLDALVGRSPTSDAHSAFKANDRRLLVLGGYSAVLPGDEEYVIPEPMRKSVRMLKNTTDYEYRACFARRPEAEQYALSYNRAILDQADVKRRRAP